MLVTKNINSSYTISEMVENHLVTKCYYGYSKKEAISIFKEEIKNEKTS
jgi:hypothetical protein